MRKRLPLILGSLACAAVVCTVIALADVQTIKVLPSPTASLSVWIDYLRDEISERLFRRSAGFVVGGGIGATDPDLTHTVSAVTAEVAGYPVAVEATAHTYTASRTTYVYLHKDGSTPSSFVISGGSGCTFAGRAGNPAHLVFVECASGSDSPVKPADSLLLFAATTDGDNITTVDDYRPSNDRRDNVVNLRDPLIGAVCNDIADDTAPINAALALAKASRRTVEIPGHATCRMLSAVEIPNGVSVKGRNWSTSIIRVVGAINGFTYAGAVTNDQQAVFEDFSVVGDPDEALVLFKVQGASWGVRFNRVRLRGTSTNALVLHEVPGFTFENGEISEFAGSGITLTAWANHVRILGTRFEDFTTASTVAAIDMAGGSRWDIRGNSFESATGLSQTALRVSASSGVLFEHNYAERYNHHLVVGHTTPSENITIRHNYLHTFAPHKLDFATDSLAHRNVSIEHNVFGGVSGISKIFLRGSTASYRFLDNARDFISVDPLNWIDGVPVTEREIVKGPTDTIFESGLSVGDWTRRLFLNGANDLRLQNEVDMSTITLHVGGTDAAVLQEIVATFAGTVQPGSVAFGAGLPVRNDGSLLYCQDCTKTAPCAGAGTGAMAKRENGIWNCD